MGNQSRLYDRLDALPWAALEPGHAEVTVRPRPDRDPDHRDPAGPGEHRFPHTK